MVEQVLAAFEGFEFEGVDEAVDVVGRELAQTHFAGERAAAQQAIPQELGHVVAAPPRGSGVFARSSGTAAATAGRGTFFGLWAGLDQEHSRCPSSLLLPPLHHTLKQRKRPGWGKEKPWVGGEVRGGVELPREASGGTGRGGVVGCRCVSPRGSRSSPGSSPSFLLSQSNGQKGCAQRRRVGLPSSSAVSVCEQRPVPIFPGDQIILSIHL